MVLGGCSTRDWRSDHRETCLVLSVDWLCVETIENYATARPLLSASSQCQRGIQSPKPTVDVVLLTRVGQSTFKARTVRTLDRSAGLDISDVQLGPELVWTNFDTQGPNLSASSQCQRGIKSPKPTVDVVLLTKFGPVTAKIEQSSVETPVAWNVLMFPRSNKLELGGVS